MTSKIDTFSTLVSGFITAKQGVDTPNFSHRVGFRTATGVKSDSLVIPYMDYSGAKIAEVGSGVGISTGASYKEYTNYESVSIKSTPNNLTAASGIFDFNYLITKINSDADNNYTVSYDDFEKIDPNYHKDELSFTLSITSEFELSVVLSKAPPSYKLRYPEKFNSDTRATTSFWDYRSNSLSEVCGDDTVKPSERFVFLRLKMQDSVMDLNIGGFRNITLTSLGKDGRFAKYADIVDLLVDAGVSMDSDDSGFVFNELKYPLRSNNSVYDITKISESNPLKIGFSVKLDAANSSCYLTCHVSDVSGNFKIDSIPMAMPYTEASSLYTTMKVSGKVSGFDLILKSIESVVTAEDSNSGVSPTGKYTPPDIYAFYQIGSGSEVFINDLDGVFSIPDNAKLIIRAIPRSYHISPSSIRMSINGSTFVVGDAVVLTGTQRYGRINARAYIVGDSTAGDSEVSAKTYVVQKLIEPPTISVNGEGEIVITSNGNVLYSTDGANPDFENRTNVALYVKPIRLKVKTYIKAITFDGNNQSAVTLYVFDPSIVYSETSTLSTISKTGTSLNGEYIEPVTVSFDGSALVRYTLDGSDPELEGNPESNIYTGPFKVLPVGSQLMSLRYSSTEVGKKSITSQVIEIPFAYKCSPWVVSKSSESVSGAVFTVGSDLIVRAGSAITRKSAIKGDFYLTLPIKDVSGGNCSLVFGFDSHMSTINNISEGEYTCKWKLPSLTFTDRVGDVVTCNVGYRKGLSDKNHFDSFGHFDWNIETPLLASVLVKDEIIPYVDSDIYIASEMYGRVYTPNKDLDGLKGVILDPLKSTIVCDIPAYEKRVLLLPDQSLYDEDIEFYITKKGNNEGSELIVAQVDGYIQRLDIGNTFLPYTSLTEEATFKVFIAADGPWAMVKVDNMQVYRNSKKMKLIVNGFETEYEDASSRELDYISMRVCEVNSDSQSNVKIGTIRGGCL